jgi:hypothetical protein
MTPKEKAEQLYKDAYMRWCYELSHDKNVSIAKNITTYMCNEILNYLKTSLDVQTSLDAFNYWEEVKQKIEKL